MRELFKKDLFTTIFFFFQQDDKFILFKFIFITSPTLDAEIIKFSFQMGLYVNYYFFIPK
jgi:hypothetical protein